ELAQAYRRLGSDVTVIEADHALGREDPELAGFALRALRADGVDLRENTKVTAVAKRGKTGVRLSLLGPDGAGTVDASHLLVAAGRKPNVEGLDLEKAGIRFGGAGIEVNAKLRTS